MQLLPLVDVKCYQIRISFKSCMPGKALKHELKPCLSSGYYSSIVMPGQSCSVDTAYGSRRAFSIAVGTLWLHLH